MTGEEKYGDSYGERIRKYEDRIATLEGYERIVKDMQERGFTTYMSVKDFLQEHEELQKNYDKQKEINKELVDDNAALLARIEELKTQIKQIYQGEAQDIRARFPC